jgi:hypothetical protein
MCVRSKAYDQQPQILLSRVLCPPVHGNQQKRNVSRVGLAADELELKQEMDAPVFQINETGVIKMVNQADTHPRQNVT